ncbi:MAG: hypothetical protein ABI682_14700 [Acidobacteriota bacterium]
MTAAGPPFRIASLVPSATEIVAALGFGDALVGRSHERGIPPGVEELPVLTAPLIERSPDPVRMAGEENLFGEAGRHSLWLAPNALAAADPDVVVVFTCGSSLEPTESEEHLLRDNPGFDRTAAAASGSVFLADGNQYFNRPGPRLVFSLEILAEIPHPEQFPFSREGVSWKRWTGK